MKNKIYTILQRFFKRKKSDKNSYLQQPDEYYRPAFIFFEEEVLKKFQSDDELYTIAHLRDEDGSTPLMHIVQMDYAFLRDDVCAFFENLSKNKLFDINQKNKQGDTALSLWVKKRVSKFLWANTAMKFNVKTVAANDAEILLSFRAINADFTTKDGENHSIVEYYDQLPRKQAKHFKEYFNKITLLDSHAAREIFYKSLERKRKFWKDMEDLSKKR